LVCFPFIAYGQLIQVPPRPSNNLAVFKKQLILHNINRFIETAKQNNVQTKQATGLIDFAKNTTTTIKPSALFSAYLGMQLQKGIFYSNMTVDAYSINNNVDTLNKVYSASLGFKRWIFSYSVPFNLHSYNIVLAKSYSIE
jgi:hypothetical protein